MCVCFNLLNLFIRFILWLPSVFAVCGLLVVVASVAGEHRLFTRRAQ